MDRDKFHPGIAPALPRARTVSAESTKVGVERAGGRRGRILVVDDDAQIRTLIGRMLNKEHEVLAVASAVKALEVIQGGERFDVVLCDLMMPRMTGMDLHAELVRTVPAQAARMLFMTGGAFDQKASDFLETVAGAPLLKPFCHTALRQLVQDRIR
jgi:CheY-like chemotaxis protein